VLFVQEEIAPRVLEMLAGAMQELAVGDPARLATDVGPIIDASAKAGLERHIAKLEKAARIVARAPLPPGLNGHFVAPVAFEIGAIAELEREVFGPVLHVVRFRGGELARVVDAINATGYGLTLGVHSRLDSTIDFIVERARVGNLYVNRNVVGAVVGVQPFGGEGKSGTGPKAGGPYSLRALSRESEDGSTPGSLAIPPLEDAVSSPLDEAVAALAAAEASLASIDRATVLQALGRQGGAVAAALAREGMAAAANDRPRELPGPTGERNTWRTHARGLTVALGRGDDDALVWLGQAMAAVAAGNPVLLASATASPNAARIAAWVRAAGWPAIFAVRADIRDWSTLPALAAVLAGSPDLARAAAIAVAARTGTRIPVIEPDSAPWRYPAWRLQAERSLSVNTVAAGGNAALLAQID